MAQPIPVTLTQVDAASYKGGKPVPLKIVGNVPGGGGGGGPTAWSDITGKPNVIASGADAAAARASISAASTSEIPTKTSLGLGSVDNTSDANKPVSGPQQTALDAKPDSASFDTIAQVTAAAYAALNPKDGRTLYVQVG